MAAPVLPRILVTGRNGQVGGALLQELAGIADVYAPGSAEMNLRDPDSVRAAVRACRPQWIVNAAAYTAVDKAESEPEIAFQINAEAPRILAEEAAQLGAPLLHFSTDYVFDGSKPAPYVETDPTAPLNVYGQSKRAGEEALDASDTACLNFRTSWVYGATGKNFLRTILKAARERDRLRIVADQRGAPTWSCDLARMVRHIVQEQSQRAASSGLSLAEALHAVRGTYHAAGSGDTTWFGFADAALTATRLHDPTPVAALEPIATAEYPTPAQRPLNSRLNCGKLHDVFGWRMQSWQESLAQVLEELRSAQAV